MSFGSPPVADQRAFYKLENANDSGANGYNLTNNNSVAFNAGRFNNGADFGSSGTNKGLTTTAYLLSSVFPSYLFLGFWFKLNSTSDISTKQITQLVTTTATAGGGIRVNFNYVISGGVGTYTIAFGASTASITFTPDTNWHWLTITMASDQGSISLRSDNAVIRNVNISNHSAQTVGFRIGNVAGLTVQSWAIFDEFIVSESVLSEANGTGQSERTRYYTQAKGRFCI